MFIPCAYHVHTMRRREDLAGMMDKLGEMGMGEGALGEGVEEGEEGGESWEGGDKEEL